MSPTGVRSRFSLLGQTVQWHHSRWPAWHHSGTWYRWDTLVYFITLFSPHHEVIPCHGMICLCTDIESFYITYSIMLCRSIVKCISFLWHILVQISPGSSSPQLSNSHKFPTFLRPVPSDITIVPGIVKLMQQFDWKHVAIITQEEDIFTLVISYWLLHGTHH